MSACRSCGQEIRWVQTASGGRMPIDPEPTPRGNVLLHPTGRAQVLSAKETETAQDLLVPLYVSHFATCPQAAEWRSR